MNAGIDYGRGTTNIDNETGIRYGVISQHSVGQAWYDSAEANYWNPHCPKCGDAVVESFKINNDDDERWPKLYSHSCEDYACESCRVYLDSSDVFGEEPIGWSYEGEGYQLTECLESDIFVLKSPYYTRARFCSPCVPGACSIESPCEDGPKAYCLGHDWFEDGKAPYRVWAVAGDTEVLPPIHDDDDREGRARDSDREDFHSDG